MRFEIQLTARGRPLTHRAASPATGVFRHAGRRGEREVAMFIRPRFWRNGRPSFRALQYSSPSRRFRVVLHKACSTDLMFVTRVVMELTRFGTAEAEFRMWEAYHLGRSLVVVTHLERAELFVEQFADRGLPATIEPE